MNYFICLATLARKLEFKEKEVIDFQPNFTARGWPNRVFLLSSKHKELGFNCIINHFINIALK